MPAQKESTYGNSVTGGPGATSHWLSEKPSEFRPMLVPDSPGGFWLPALLFLCFTLLVFLRVFDYRRMTQLIAGFFRSSSVYQLYREEYALTSRVSVFLLLNFIITSAIFIWQASGFFSGQNLPPVFVLWFALGILGAYFLKILSTRIIGGIFEAREAALEYSYNVVLFNKTVGLLLFPVTVFVAYAREVPVQGLIWGGLGFWSLALIYRLLRLFLIGMSIKRISFFYIILYLCTLEMIPFVVVVKMLKGLI